MTKTVMVLGADGMLGHKVLLTLASTKNIKVIGTVRGNGKEALDCVMIKNMIDLGRLALYPHMSANMWPVLSGIIRSYSPDYVVNCVGIIKQREEDANNTRLMLETNALFPHQVAEVVRNYGGTTISFSSDCIYLGNTAPSGKYTEDCEPDAWSLYGRTKYLGEIGEDTNSLTLRTSFIGYEIKGYTSLLEWFLEAVRQQKQDGKPILGFSNAIWSGVTTKYLAGLISMLIQEDWKPRGVYQLASPEPVSKFELLSMIDEALELGAEIVEDARLVPDKVCNRALDGKRFEKDFGIAVRPIQGMIQGLKDDYAIYAEAYPERYGS